VVADKTGWAHFLVLFRRTLADRGWVEGKNVTFEFSSAHDDPSRFAAAAQTLVESDVDVVWAVSAPALRAAHAATRTIPIVGIDYTADPIAEGYVQSYGRPGGNVTGIFLDAPDFAGKWFELLQAMIPELSSVAVLWDPAPGTTHLLAARKIAKSLDIRLQILEVRTPDDIDNAFAAIGKSQAVIILPSPMIYNESVRLARLALTHKLPAISFAREFAVAGGAVAYGPEDNSATESLAVLVAKILGGANPAELPVERPTRIQLLVNGKTAKALGITIPQSILLRADEVIK
jgi:putative ABC transport system substrate-binding protein